MPKAYLYLLSLSIAIISCGQHLKTSQVPSIVQNTLQAKFSTAKEVEWKKKGSLYQAEFDIDTIEYEAQIDTSGKFLALTKEIKTNELPVAISSAISRELPDYSIDEVTTLETGGIVYYQVELEKKGAKDKKLVYGREGKIITTIKYID
ncbi:MAG: PepSY-like domain-containing protein [Chitinophagaceae bacterium]